MRERAPEPPTKRNHRVPRDLEVICLKCLEKDPARRYASAQSLADDLLRFLNNEPILARPVSALTRAWFWCRRKQALAASVAGLVTAVVFGITGITWYWNEASRRTESEQEGARARDAVQALAKVADIGFDDLLDPLQRVFLEFALAYYEEFTSRVARDPTVRLEHGRIYQQMGDILRKLGRLPRSKDAYLKAIEILDSLANHSSSGPDPKRTLARTRTLLADLLVRSGGDKGQAESLYAKALEAQQAQANTSTASTEDLLRLGQTLKSQGELLRLDGKWTEAASAFDRSIIELERALALDVKHPEIRNALALAIEARAWVHREVGVISLAEKNYRRALDLLERLVAEFPTIPRHREWLAKVCRSLGILAHETNRLDEAEAHLRREIPLVEQLAQDFPYQPEYRREQARALNVLGDDLRLRGNVAEADVILRRAIELDNKIIAESPDDVLIRFQLAMAHHNFGVVLTKQGKNEAAIESFRKAQVINQALVKEFPKTPSYASNLATNFDSLALALDAAGQPGADQNFGDATTIYERLISSYPANVDYPIWEADCLRNQGLVLAEAGRIHDAHALYRKALKLLESVDAILQTPDGMRKQAIVLSNLGALHGADAEDAFHRSIAVSKKLLSGRTGTTEDRFNLAIGHNNLGELLIEQKRLPEAGPHFTEAVTNLERLVAEVPKSLDFQQVFGNVLAGQAKWMNLTDKTADARAALTAAVEHQRHAVQLSRNAPVCTLALAQYLTDLADTNRKLGAYDDAAKVALEVPKVVAVASRPQACFDAAKVLARVVNQAGADDKLSQAERDRLTRIYLNRIVVLLMEAIDSNPKLADEMAASRDFETVRSHPVFKTIFIK